MTVTNVWLFFDSFTIISNVFIYLTFIVLLLPPLPLHFIYPSIFVFNLRFAFQKKAKASHAALEKFALINNELPLYNQPSDTGIYHTNKRK